MNMKALNVGTAAIPFEAETENLCIQKKLQDKICESRVSYFRRTHNESIQLLTFSHSA